MCEQNISATMNIHNGEEVYDPKQEDATGGLKLEDPTCTPKQEDSISLDSVENIYTQFKGKFWNPETTTEFPKVLDPDDPLMARFQSALEAHLLRINNRLDEDISELESSIKDANNNRDEEALQLYNLQKEIKRQQSNIEKLQQTLTDLMKMREEKDAENAILKRKQQELVEKLKDDEAKDQQMTREIENLSELVQQYKKWEEEMSNHLAVSKRISEKDAIAQKQLLCQKQQEDYILFKLMSEIWKLESQVESLKEQAELKEKEKADFSQAIADANADLEGLQKEQKNLCTSWKSVVTSIRQRNKMYDELCEELQRKQESIRTLQCSIDKVKQETQKEMDHNEELTALKSRIEENIQTHLKMTTADRDKISHLQAELSKLSKMNEKSTEECKILESECQHYMNLQVTQQKECAALAVKKAKIEDEILIKLGEKVIHDKATRHLNKVLKNLKKVTREKELLLVQAENAHSKALLDLERSKNAVANHQEELDEFVRMSSTREKEIQKIEAEIKKSEIIIRRNEQQADRLNKKIEAIVSKTGGKEISPLEQKVLEMEENIKEKEHENKKLQQQWLREEENLVRLTQQRNAQLHNMALINNQITIVEQKNGKLEADLERLKREEINMDRVIEGHQKKLSKINSELAKRKDYKNIIEDKTFLQETESLASLKELESSLVAQENKIKALENEKLSLTEELNALQRDTLSWEKKVQLASETMKNIKKEQSSSGDIGIMKSEIHKMEIRLSHLKKVQEKLIQDMEHSVARRDAIVDAAMAKEKRNPQCRIKQRAVFRRRLEHQKTELKQLKKERRNLEHEVADLQIQKRAMEEQLTEQQEQLTLIKNSILDIEKQIEEAQITKEHNLEVIIRKQRQVKMYQDIRRGQYKMLYKSEAVTDAELKKQRQMNADLKEIVEQTQNDFPLLKNATRRILLTLNMG